MDALVGFHVDAWDYLTFAATFIIVPALLTLGVLILGLPGGIAVNLMGYIGILAVVPRVKTLTWAFRPTDVIRYTPGEERRETAAIFARIIGKTGPREEPSPSRQSHTS